MAKTRLITLIQDKSTGFSSQLPYLGLLFVVLAWGSGPVFAKLITAEPAVGVVLRFGISFPVLFAIVSLRRRRVPMATFWRAAPAGVAFGINLMFVFETVQNSTVAVLAVATALQPALILVVVGPVFGERPTRIHIAWTAVGVVGAVAVILGAGSDLRASPTGLLFALLAVLTFTFYFVLTRHARTTAPEDPVEWMAAVNLWAFFAAIPPALLLVDVDDFSAVGGADWLWIAVLAYVTGVFGHVLMSWVHGYIEAARSSLGLLSMNLVAVSLAWPVHDEPVTPTQALGGVVVLGAVAAVLRLPVRKVESAPDLETSTVHKR